ncbi:sulfur carrier protein ThiS [Thiopseudomonas acetoxidans]|uniref:Sulfur carrier protein ThiS n=1 Tax=Thiopseudomonas acetoxidans TaxID=3041622 RepID=A0ABT7SKJ8_9GAMM|nr:sulfur carrier protein ThiS [Thiopseudomonas sp. CY1220]MDM7856715.1 sulfur carrier protein ThiS [Thiopseudomonas sp. CY1220]
MHIQLNGKAYPLPQQLTLAQLLEQLELTGKRLAVEVNLAIVPRSQHEQHVLQAGDKVEIVHAIGGG